VRKISYAGYRFPPEVIHQAIWLYLRFTLSFRDVEDSSELLDALLKPVHRASIASARLAG